MEEEVITLDSSSEEEDSDDVPLRKLRYGTVEVHLPNVNNPIEKSADSSGRIKDQDIEEITLFSSEDEDEGEKLEAKQELDISKEDSDSSEKPSTLGEHCEEEQNIVKDEETWRNEEEMEVLRDDIETSCLGTNISTSPCLQNLIDVLKKVMKCKKELTQLTKKLRKYYGKMSNQPPDLLAVLDKRIILVTNHLTAHPELNFWTLMKQLLNQFNVEKLNETFNIEFGDDDKKLLEDYKKKKVLKLEKQMNEISKKIKELDEAEVDWDQENDQNSEFMMRERLIKRYMIAYSKICSALKCSALTGRPVQKAITLKSTTKYPEIEQAIEALVNKGYKEMVDYTDVLEEVKRTNTDKSLHLAESDIQNIAQVLHRTAVEIRQKYRELDVPLGYPPSCDHIQDPAENDVELEKKLQRNTELKRSIRSVADEFVEKQVQKNLSKRKPKVSEETTVCNGNATINVENEVGQEKEDEEDDVDENEEEDEDDEDEEETDGDSTVADSFVNLSNEEEEVLDAWDEQLHDYEGEDSQMNDSETAIFSDIILNTNGGVTNCQNINVNGNGQQAVEDIDGPPTKKMRTENEILEAKNTEDATTSYNSFI